MKKHFLFISIILPFHLLAQSFSSPESVEYDAANGRYLVSNRGTVKSIQSVIPGQQPTLFTSNVTSPAGLEILGNKLWVCDGGRLKSYDLASGTLVNNINLSATFLNGITSDGGHFLFVSDYSAKKIYRVNTNTEAYYTMVSNTVSSPNGMWYDGANNRLLFVNWGSNAPVKAVSLADSSVSTVANTSLGNCDGITRDAQGNFYVSAWSQQAVYRFDSNFSSPQQVVSGLSNPADICYNTLNDTLAIPNTNNNTVTFHFLGTTVSANEQEKTNLNVYPNPAKTNAVFEYTLPAPSSVKLSLYGIDGKTAIAEITENQNKGKNHITLERGNLAAGQYFYRLETGEKSFSGKIIFE